MMHWDFMADSPKCCGCLLENFAKYFGPDFQLRPPCSAHEVGYKADLMIFGGHPAFRCYPEQSRGCSRFHRLLTDQKAAELFWWFCSAYGCMGRLQGVFAWFEWSCVLLVRPLGCAVNGYVHRARGWGSVASTACKLMEHLKSCCTGCSKGNCMASSGLHGHPLCEAHLFALSKVEGFGR